MSEESLHVHLGPGCLGLGLVVSSSARAGLEVHVVSPEGRSRPTSNGFELEIVGAPDGQDRVEKYAAAGFWEASAFENLAAEVREAVLHRPHLLITTSLTTEGLEAAQEFILEVVDVRRAAGLARSTTFIAAENDAGPSWDKFRAALESRDVRVLRTMVNRYCPSKSDENGVRRVVVDVEQEWVIELPKLPIPPPLAMLAQLPHVEVVASAEAFETRKLWLINGTHLALAIVARSTRGIQKLNVAGAEPGRQQWVSSLQHELSRALHVTGMTVHDDVAYGSRHFESVLRHEDSVGRILRRFRRGDLTSFLADFELKLGRAMRLQMESDGELARVFQEVLDELQKLLLKLDAFEDAAAIRRGEIWMSEAADETSIRSYELLLTRTLVQDLVPERLRVLRRVWARHRDRFERRSGQDRRKQERRRSVSGQIPDRRAGHDRRRGVDRRRV
jgi:hypothetical protein